jgi:tRNA (guanine37-N1)-methyltransferase
LLLRIDVLTLFPGMFGGFLGESIIKLAREKGLLDVRLFDIREHAGNKHGKVDDRPYGGGPGMVMAPGPVFRCVEAVLGRPVGPGTPPVAEPPRVRPLLLTPQGRRLDQRFFEDLARAERILLVCGRYEGFDERIRSGLGFEEVSIGDYVLSGGEAAAMVVIDGVVRLLPGALGDETSAGRDSFALVEGRPLLEAPQYTRPPVFRGMAVPEVLLSGDHAAIERWRRERALERTRERRPDLLAGGEGRETRES